MVERLAKLAIKLFERLIAEEAGDYRQELAAAWDRLSDHLDENQRRDEAIEARMMALRLFRELVGRQRTTDAEEAPNE